MDTSDYLPMFLAECREHLQSLNLAIVRLEENAEDRETIDEIFRIAHSLKGMSATMGFAHMAELTHAMEDVFDLLRQRKGALERDVVDLLFECLDALSAAVDSIESDGAEQLDPATLVGRLHALVRSSDEEEAIAEKAAAPVVVAAQGRVLHVSIRLADDVSMPAVRAVMLATALKRHGEVVATQPADLEKLDARELEIWVASADAEDAVAQTALAVPEVAGAEVVARASAGDKAGSGHGAPKGAATVRVDAERLDQLMHLMGELVVHRTHLEALTLQADVPGLQQAMQDLTRSAQGLQAMVMQVRMIPVDAVFVRLPRLVRDLSSKLDKDVELVLGGRETELDRTVVDALGDPLVHLVRNALDHGLEPPEEREKLGKPAKGRLEIVAQHQGGNVVISVQDDGRGLDPAKIAAVAV
ncbi:MAG: Hpt domain-containing protein, partial [Actinobacteria bacterium]|nr:Hpt domain-containing protein [Actinomycetota bacterium]